MNILTIDHTDFTLEIDLANARGVADFEYAFETAEKRHTPENFETAYLFSGVVKKFQIWMPASKKVEIADIHAIKHPVFFENIAYTVSVDFHPDVVDASFYSRVKNVRSLFKVRETKGGNAFGSGDLTFNNEPGEFDLIIDYDLKTVSHSMLFQFTVFSAKLDSKKDHPVLVKQIEDVYPRLAIDYLRKTYHHFGTEGRGDSDILWWTIFGNIFRSLLRHLKVIVENPYKELSAGREAVRDVSIKKAKGPLADKLERYSGQPDKYFEVKKKSPAEDNYENRYVKHIITDILEHYQRIYKKVLKDSSITRMDKQYRMQLEFVGVAIATLPTHPVFKTVGKHKDGKRYSPVLGNRPGYTGLIRDWEMLKMGFELQEGLYEIELKDIAYLYQIWCFFGMAGLLEQITGVAPEIKKMPKIKISTFRLSPDKNMHSKIVFPCADGTNIELYQELRYTNDFDAADAGTFDGHVCPDIILRIGKKDQPRNLYLTYLFDAKYRLVETTRYDMIDKMDEPLPQDLTKMRDYREAIYNRKKKGQRYEHSKEVMGAYVLFPGKGKLEYYERYYREIILATNIGGFPFLPGNTVGSTLLEKHLRFIITEDAARLLDKVPPQKGRTYKVADAYVFVDLVAAADYGLFEELVAGEAALYPCRTFDQAVGDGKVRYFAPYIEGRGIPCFYEITGTNLKSRRRIFPPGHPAFRDEGRKYMILKLANKEMLDDYVQIKGMAGNRRYTQIKYLYGPKYGFISTVPEKDVYVSDHGEESFT
jgi:hypothetical protein